MLIDSPLVSLASTPNTLEEKKKSQCLQNGICDGNYRHNLVIFLLEDYFTLPAPLDVSLLERKMQAGCFGRHLEF